MADMAGEFRADGEHTREEGPGKSSPKPDWEPVETPEEFEPEISTTGEPEPVSRVHFEAREDAPGAGEKIEAAPPTPAPQPTEESKPGQWIQYLRKMGLWPPETDARGEAGLIQWWFPRIGGLLAILAVVFFAAYVARGTPPWVRFLELIIADMAVLGAGWWFWKRRPRFGQVVLSVGLTMLYVSSVAAYVARPVRVIDSAVLGVAVQFACILSILFLSGVLKRIGILHLSLIFGYVSSIFTAFEGFQEAALITSALLYLSGLVGGRYFGNASPWILSLPGAYLVVLAYIAFYFIGSTRLILPETVNLWIYLSVILSLFPAAGLAWPAVPDLPHGKRRILHSLNTTLAIGLGYVLTRQFGGNLVWFYGIFAILFAAWAGVFASQGLNSFRFQLFFLKGAALAALWAIVRFDGEIRWLALLLDSILLAAFCVRSKSVTKEVGAWIVWGLAGYYLVKETFPLDYDPWGWPWAALVLFGMAGAAMHSLLYLKLPRTLTRVIFYRSASFAHAAITAFVIHSADVNDSILPFHYGLPVLAHAGIFMVPLFRSESMLLSGLWLLGLGHICFWFNPSYWAAFEVLEVVTVLAAFIAATRISSSGHRFRNLPESLFHILWMVSLFALLTDRLQEFTWFYLLAPGFSLLFLLSGRRPWRTLAEMSIIPWILLVGYLFYEAPTRSVALALTGSGILYGLVLRGYLAVFRLGKEQFRWFGARNPDVPVQTILTLQLAVLSFEWKGTILLISSMGCVLLLGFLQFGKKLFLVCSLFLQIAVLSGIVTDWLNPGYGLYGKVLWGSDYLTGSLMSALLVLGSGLLVHGRLSGDNQTRLHSRLTYLYGGLTLVYAALGFSYPEIHWIRYFTPILAGVCVLMIVLGMGFRLKAYRIVAIIGLLLPLARLFVVDVRETLPRIIAFAVLALFITGVGFLYHKYQTRIE